MRLPSWIMKECKDTRVCACGCRQSVGEYEDAFAKLETFTRTRWPQAKSVIHRWSGQVHASVCAGAHAFGRGSH